MAFLDFKEVHQAYLAAVKEAKVWRTDYPEYERLMNNGLIDNLDETLPEVNDGSLSASLFKLPKRIVSSKLRGQVKVLNAPNDKSDWLRELANIEWQKTIVPNANSQAPFHRKWKDAVRKAAGYGGQPIVNFFGTNGNYEGSDFIVPYCQDVKLEAGKVSDYDSDIIFWDVYYSRLQLKNIIEEATEESKPKKPDTKDSSEPQATDSHNNMQTNESDDDNNEWDIPALQEILDGDGEEDKPAVEDSHDKQGKGVKKNGFHFYIAFQRGIEAPFMMIHRASKKSVRNWDNPDPTGDVPVHYLYCYQDFINPYGVGIVKLAGGTQNVLDYMRQADVKATQLGIDPPLDIHGNTDDADIDSFVSTQRALWFSGSATVTPVPIANAVYNELPNRIAMYQTSLQKLIPIGDTSVGAGAGDNSFSKTPAGVRQQAANLSIDDEDFKDNFYMTYNAVAKSMINTHFANMQGSDIRTLTDDERTLLTQGGIQFPGGEDGTPTNELDVKWDTVRATFDFEVDPSSGDKVDDAQMAQNLGEALSKITPQVNYYMGQDGWKFNLGEAYYNLFSKMNLENIDKIITKMSDEEKQQAQQQPFPIIDPPQIRLTGQIPNGAMGAALQQGGVQVPQGIPMEQEQVDIGDIYKDPTTPQSEKAQIVQQAGIQPDMQARQQQESLLQQQQAMTAQPTAEPQQPQSDLNNPQLQDIIKQYKVTPDIAAAMLAAEKQGYHPQDIIDASQQHAQMLAEQQAAQQPQPAGGRHG